MPRKQDNDTRIHFRIFEDETHAQKRAFCLNCNKDACADNIQRMKNHLLKCEAFINGGGGVGAPPGGNEPVYQLQMDGPIAPDASMQAMGQHMPNPGAMPDGSSLTGPAHQQDPNASTISMQPPPAQAQANPSGMMASSQGVSHQASKAAPNSLDKVRQAMGRSTKRMESLEAVLKTQVQDGMHNAATHVRAALRDEKDRLFKLSQTLVKQEMKIREAQNAIGNF